MKKIIQNWRNFIIESKKEEIQNLKFGPLKNKSHIKKLSEIPKHINLTLSEIPISKYPANDSDRVKKELKHVLDKMTDKEGPSKEKLEETDKKSVEMYFKYMDENDLDYDKEYIRELSRDVSIIVLGLKMRYGRPRPEQLGPKLGYDVRSIKTETDDTPAYPSGHTAQAWTLAYYLAEKHPEHKSQIFSIAQEVEDSRIFRGAHYPSDNKEAKHIAKNYLFKNIEGSE